MFTYHSLVTLCLASSAVGVVFHRGSANQSVPYFDFTGITPLPAPPKIPVESFVVSPSEVRLQSASSSTAGVSSEYVVVQPTTDTGTSGPPSPSTFANSTLSAIESIPNKKPSPPNDSSSAASEIAPFPINSAIELTTRTSNATCTVNIPSASLDYWFKPTYSHVVATLTTAASNFTDAQSYTLVPHTGTFDAASALESDFVCTYTESYYSEFDFTMTMCEEYTETPTAATTSIIYRSDGYSPFPSGGVIPVSDVGLYDLYLPDSFPSATTIVTLAPNVTQVETSATPFVYFTAYEVETGNKTETIQLPSTQAYPYWLEAVEDKDTATGLLPQGFLEQVPHSACNAGQLQAVVIVLIIVDLYYYNRPNLDPALIHFESSVLGFEDPPFVVNDWDKSRSRTVPITVADWSLPSDPKSTTASAGLNHLPELAPTTRVRGGHIQPGVPQSRPPPLLTVGSSTITPNAATQFFIAPGQTLTPGGTVTVDGTAVSLAPSASFVVIGGSTQVFPTGPLLLQTTIKQAQIVVGGATITAQAAQDKPSSGPIFVISGETLLPGGLAVSFAGNTLSLESAGDVLVVNGATSTLDFPILQASPPSITIGNEIFSALPKPSGPAFVIADQTLLAGGPEIVVSDTTLSLASSASFVVVNGATSTLTEPAAAHITAPLLTIGDVVFRPLPGTGTAYLIGSILLTAGGSIVVSGATISLAPGATALVINGQTSLISPQVPLIITNPPLLTIDKETYTAIPGGGTTFVIGTGTLTPGGTITVDGTTISLAAGATELIYGSSGRSTTTALFPATTTQSQSITHASRASTGGSGLNGQASATAQKEGAATLSSGHIWIPLTVAFLCSFLA